MFSRIGRTVCTASSVTPSENVIWPDGVIVTCVEDSGTIAWPWGESGTVASHCEKGGVWHKALMVGSGSLWRRLLASRP